MKAHSVLRWSAFAAILLTIASVGILGTDRDAVTIQHVVATGGVWSPVIFVFGYAIATVLFVPGSVFTLAGGALFGPVAGALYSLVGATAGATLAFLVARFVAGDWVARKAQARLEHFVLGVEHEGWRFGAFVRLVPLIPFNLLNYVLGLTRIPLGQYILASFICMMPGAFAYAYLGFAGREAAFGGQYMLQQASIALALLAAAIFLPRLVVRLRRPSIAHTNAVSVHDRIVGRDPPTILDVRGGDEYRGELGHIPGSINIPLTDLPDALSQRAALSNKALIVVCKTDRRSAKAAEVLVKAGFQRIEVMQGGMESWTRFGLPVLRSGSEIK